MALAPIALAATAISAGVGLVGAISQGQAQAAQARYQAGVARNNQIIAQQNASYEAQAGRVASQNADFMHRQQLGAIEAAQAASGFDTATGSPSEVRQSQEQLNRLDTMNIMAQALLRSRASDIQATNFGAESKLDTQKAGYAESAGYLQGFGTLLGGASSFADKWLSYQQKGLMF